MHTYAGQGSVPDGDGLPHAPLLGQCAAALEVLVPQGLAAEGLPFSSWNTHLEQYCSRCSLMIESLNSNPVVETTFGKVKSYRTSCGPGWAGRAARAEAEAEARAGILLAGMMAEEGGKRKKG